MAFTSTPSTSAATVEHADPANPDIELPGAKKSKRLALMPELDPAFPVTCLSMLCNFAMSHMVIYGATGNMRLAYLMSTMTIPVSLAISVYDAKKDYERWWSTKRMRERGVAEKFMPYKVKYDWSSYAHRMKAFTPPTTNTDAAASSNAKQSNGVSRAA